MTWVELTSLGGRRMVVRPEEIAFMAEHPAPEGKYNASGIWQPGLAWTDVVLRNGDKGECRQTIEQILQQAQQTGETQ